MSSLPLVRGKDRVKPTPDGDAVKKAAEVVETTPESITYLFERAEKSGVLTPELQSMFEDISISEKKFQHDVFNFSELVLTGAVFLTERKVEG